MARVAIFGTDSALAEALAACLARDGGKALRIGPDPGPDGVAVADPLREEAVAAAFAAAGPLAGLVCATADTGAVEAGAPGWSRWIAASRSIATVALLGLKHGGPRVAPGGAIVLTAAPGRPDDAAASAARGLLLGLARGASGGFAARGIRVNHVASVGAAPAADRAEAVAFLLSEAARFVTGTDVGRGRQEEP
jgi:NAD(P)-dependent dehydrogenase (short-subunit alcohol dehydrogenase family)